MYGADLQGVGGNILIHSYVWNKALALAIVRVAFLTHSHTAFSFGFSFYSVYTVRLYCTVTVVTSLSTCPTHNSYIVKESTFVNPLISQVRVVVPELLHTSACEAASAKQPLLQVQQSTRRIVVRLQVLGSHCTPLSRNVRHFTCMLTGLGGSPRNFLIRICF